MKRVVIVGASAAGAAAAEALRRDGYDGELVVVGEEPSPPYDRTALSKDLLLGRRAIGDLALLESDVAPLGAEWRLGTRAVGLLPAERSVELAGGERLRYDGLVIATGAAPRTLRGTAVQGVRTLRTIEDAVALDAMLVAGVRLVIVGGGFVGLELAAAARARGAEVTVLELGLAPLAHALGVAVGAALMARHVAAGVRVETGAAVVGFAGRDRVSHVMLAGGRRVPADLVVVGVGAAPATGWLAGSELGRRSGVPCDATLATAVDGVVAAGDVACWPHPAVGAMVRVEHWENACAQGAAAARRLLHGPGQPPFAPTPFFWSEQGDDVLHIAGFPSPDAQLDIVEGDLRGGSFAVSYRFRERVAAVAALNSPRTFRRLRRELEHEGGVPA